MQRIFAVIARLRDDRRGQTASEYALILFLGVTVLLVFDVALGTNPAEAVYRGIFDYYEVLAASAALPVP